MVSRLGRAWSGGQSQVAHVTTKCRGHHLHPPGMDASTAPLIKHHAYHVTSFWMEATLLLLRGSTLATSLRGHNHNHATTASIHQASAQNTPFALIYSTKVVLVLHNTLHLASVHPSWLAGWLAHPRFHNYQRQKPSTEESISSRDAVKHP